MPDTAPIRFSPDLEHPAQDEAAVNAELVKTLRGIIATTSAHYGHAVRGVHAKSHAILEGEMIVGDLPPELAQGAFARPGTFPGQNAMPPWWSTRSGGHLSAELVVPANITIVPLPPECPELNPQENVW